MIVDSERLESDAAYRQDLQHRFLTDGFFAANILGFTDFSPLAHEPVFNRLYFPKNRNIPIRDQHRKKKRIHFDPRHSFKTTAKRVDRAQMMCAFMKEFTSTIGSATQPLALAVATKSARVFYRPPRAPAKLIHLIFPELVIDKEPEVDPKKGWNHPLRREDGAGDLDPTLAFTSPKTTQSGWHPIVLELDDVEDPKNSGIHATADVRQNVIDTCDTNENLLRDGGYMNITGTRYHPFDYYGQLVNRAAANPEVWEVLIRPSIRTVDGTRLLPGEFPAEEDIELVFPGFANLSYRELRDKFFANYETFMCQQQNDPQGGSISRFEERMFNAAQIAPSRIPREGETFICWRPRYGGNKKTMRYSEGACARVCDGKIFVLDAWQGQYTISGEAEKVVAAVQQHDVDGLMVIGVPGSEYVEMAIANEGLRRNRSIRIERLDWYEDEGHRNSAMENLEPMIKSGRVLFSTQMGKAAECRTQFIHFGLVEENGIIESISKFADLVPMSLMRANITEQEMEWARQRRDDALLSQFMDQQGLDPADELMRQQTTAQVQAMQETTTFTLPPMPGGLDG